MKKVLLLLLMLSGSMLFAQSKSDTLTMPTMPEINLDSDTVAITMEDFDFLMTGLNFIESCTYFGDFYHKFGRDEIAVNYYSLALQMYENLNGFEEQDFSNQIKQLRLLIEKISK